MLFLKIIAFFPLMFAFPDLRVNWSGGQLNAVRVVAEGKDEVMEQCVKSGLEVRYRYELRICKRRFLWADSCNDPKVEVHSLQYDPISESYRVMVDKIGDNEAAKTTTATAVETALGTVTQYTSPPLADLGYNSKKYPESRSPYLGVRVIADCKGDYNETLAKISNFLSLGLLDVGTSDSGWVDFRLSH